MPDSQTKQCQNCKQDFVVAPEDFEFYEKIKVSAPKLCPNCRYQRRIANRNEWNFYKRDCALCGKNMVSIYNPDYPGPVFCQPCFWSDKWNPMDYGREIDFSRPFFEQFFKHRLEVPRIALANSKSVNSEYSNQSEENRNCYMVVATGTSENCMYGNWNQGSRECVDCWAVKKCEIMYESLNCEKCFRCFFTENSMDTRDSYFCDNCRGCSNCFGCVSLRNKKFCWFNEQLSKEEYEAKIKNIKWTSQNIADFKEKIRELSRKIPHKYYNGAQNINSTGDYLINNKNTKETFNARLNEDFRYGQDAWEARDCMDLTETLDNELDYEMEGSGWGHNCIASSKSWHNHNILYSELNFNSHNIFGCVSLMNKSYCIFNKQYNESEYRELRDKLIEQMKKNGEWGEFPPIEISPFPYNDSLAQDYFPMSKESVLKHGWRWYDKKFNEYKVTLEHKNLPETIGQADDSILKEIISCSSQDSEEKKRKHLSCVRVFRIIPAELEFYRKNNLPIPHFCFPCRLQNRLNLRNPRKLWSRPCQCSGSKSSNDVYTNQSPHFHGEEHCPNEFETSYAPDRPEIVYCEKCYQSEVV